MTLRMASLFDGSGGFPLAAKNEGITPIWASEIEPFPIRVTTKRLPEVKHYGNVAEIDGSEVEPVDIITFGSPCQDMSVAGKRAGVEHICRLVHGGIILYNLRELSQKLSESYIKAQTPSTSPWNKEFSYGVMVACEYWLGIEKNGGDK